MCSLQEQAKAAAQGTCSVNAAYVKRCLQLNDMPRETSPERCIDEHTCCLHAGSPAWQQGIQASRSFAMPRATCADASLEALVRWVLMQDMDKLCGWQGPTTLACNRLLSPSQLCVPDTMLTAASGSLTDGVPPGGTYSASSECSWTVSTPEQPYISMNFSHFNTELRYDVLTVEARTRGCCEA